MLSRLGFFPLSLASLCPSSSPGRPRGHPAPAAEGIPQGCGARSVAAVIWGMLAFLLGPWQRRGAGGSYSGSGERWALPCAGPHDWGGRCCLGQDPRRTPHRRTSPPGTPQQQTPARRRGRSSAGSCALLRASLRASPRLLVPDTHGQPWARATHQQRPGAGAGG